MVAGGLKKKKALKRNSLADFALRMDSNFSILGTRRRIVAFPHLPHYANDEF